LVVGILRETKNKWERRTPLIPPDVKWLIKRGIRVEVESSPIRIFGDSLYKEAGAKVAERFKEASLLVGIKEPLKKNLYRDAVYMVFSHTSKGQKYNMPLFKKMIERKITLIDYEKIADINGRRLVYFGRFAGICGLFDTLHYFGKKIEYRGIRNIFCDIMPAHRYNSLHDMRTALIKLRDKIFKKGLDESLCPFIFGITGHGNVSSGIQEMLDLLKPIEIHPADMLEFVGHKKHVCNKVYKVVLGRSDRLRSKYGGRFNSEEYLQHPDRYESNMEIYLPHLNILLNASYWDSRFPRLITKEMLRHIYFKDFRLEFIADISCDINGAIELTHKLTTPDKPVFTYNIKTDRFKDGFRTRGITVLAIDNLPAELPREASCYFSSAIREYVYQIAVHGAKDITNHVALPREIRKAAIVQEGRLTPRFKYLRKYI